MKKLPGYAAEASLDRNAANYLADAAVKASGGLHDSVVPAAPSCARCIPSCNRVCGIYGVRSTQCRSCWHTCLGFCV